MDPDEDNQFTPRGWEKLVNAVSQRNSREGMTKLELIGEPYACDDEESDEQTNSESVCGT